MKLTLLLLSLLSFQLAHAASLSSQGSSHRIRVRVQEQAEGALLIRALDLRAYEFSKAGERELGKSNGMSEWRVQCAAKKISVRIGDQSFLLDKPFLIETPAGLLHLNGKPYHDALRIYARPTGCEIVNEVDIEKYLDGLVNSEFSASWNEEAIAAQVVAARTYALYQILEARLQKVRNHFDIDASTKDQVYGGSQKEDFRASRVVEHTHGQVLTVGTDNDPTPIKAFYHSICGGQTELPQNIWGKPYPGFRSVKCAYCAGAPHYEWSLSLTAKELESAWIAGAKSGGAPVQWPSTWPQILATEHLTEIRVTGVTDTGRVSKIESVWNQTVHLDLDAPLFRTWIGPAKLKSLYFKMEQKKPLLGPAEWFFNGKGNGHGAGMCQWGAKRMGEKGFTFEQILHFYYPGAVLRKLW